MKHTALASDHAALIDSCDVTNDMLKRLMEKEAAREAREYSVYKDNFIVAFVRKIMKTRKTISVQGAMNNEKHSTTTLEAFGEHMPNKGWAKDINLDENYIDTVREVGKWIQKRNSAAHDTHRDFARVLLSEACIMSHGYHYYSPLFGFVYGETIQEAAAK